MASDQKHLSLTAPPYLTVQEIVTREESSEITRFTLRLAVENHMGIRGDTREFTGEYATSDAKGLQARMGAADMRMHIRERLLEDLTDKILVSLRGGSTEFARGVLLCRHKDPLTQRDSFSMAATILGWKHQEHRTVLPEDIEMVLGPERRKDYVVRTLSLAHAREFTDTIRGMLV